MRNAHSTFDYSSMSNASLKTDTPLGYKQTEVGIIPDDWECLPSKERISYLGGYAFSSRSAKSDGIRWLKIANVGVNEVKWDAESYLPNSFSENHPDYLLAESDVVMALTRPLLGERLKVATLSKFDIPALLNQRVAKLSAKNSCNQKYIYYLVQTSDYISAMNLAMAGSDPPNIGTKTLGDILIAIPCSRDEQTAIANALSDLDALIQELEKLIAKKQAIKTATMQQLLTGRTRLPQFAHHPDGRKKGYKPSAIGNIPEDWEVRPLSDLSTYINDGTHHTPKYVQQGVPFYSVENVTANDFTNVKYISLEEHKKLIRRCLPEKGDILMTRIGTLGITRLIDWDVDASIYVSLALIKLKSVVDSKYVYIFSKSEIFFKEVEKRSLVNATPQKINMNEIGQVPIAFPTDKEEQSKISIVLSDALSEIQILENRLNKTRQIKQGMMQELLTGKTRLVKPAGVA